MLRRAGNVLTSNGQPVKELDVDSDVPSLPGSPPPRRHKLGLVGASIKRRLQEVVGGSTGRSRSAGGLGRSPRAPAPSTDAGNSHVGRSHARSLSDIPIAPTPIFDHATGEPTPSTSQASALSDKRHPAGAQPSSVPEVSTILSGEQEVMSPVPEQPPTASSSAPQLKDVLVPQLLQQGTPMTKVSAKKHKKFVFRLDADLGQIVWESVSKQQKISEWLSVFYFIFMRRGLVTYRPYLYFQYRLRISRRFGRGRTRGIIGSNSSSRRNMKIGGLRLSISLMARIRRYISSWQPRTCSRSGIRLCASYMPFGRS